MKEFNDLYDQYKQAVEKITIFFGKKYFDNHYVYSQDDWVNKDIGGVIMINDHYFTVENMLDFLKYDYSEKDMFAYYTYALNGIMETKHPINIKHFRNLKKR